MNTKTNFVNDLLPCFWLFFFFKYGYTCHEVLFEFYIIMKIQQLISNTNEHIVIVYEAQTRWFGGRIRVGHGFVANMAEHVSDTCLLLFIYLFSGHAYPCWSDSPAPFLTTPASFFSWCTCGPMVLRQQLYAGPMSWPSRSTKQLVRRGHISLFVTRETLIGSTNKGPHRI